MYGAVYDKAVMLSAGSTNKEYAKNLFAALREFDELGVEVVFAEFSEKDGYGLAVKNRLYKAAAQRVIKIAHSTTFCLDGTVSTAPKLQSHTVNDFVDLQLKVSPLWEVSRSDGVVAKYESHKIRKEIRNL